MKYLNLPEMKKISGLFNQFNSETSYHDKTYSEAEENIKKWQKTIKDLNLTKHDFKLWDYILKSRFQNIQILKEFHGKKETSHFE